MYLLIFALLAVGVSGWVQSSPASLAVLLGLWLVASVVAPRIAVLAADILRPVPSSIAFLQSYEATIGHKYVDDNSFTAFNETFEGPCPHDVQARIRLKRITPTRHPTRGGSSTSCEHALATRVKVRTALVSAC